MPQYPNIYKMTVVIITESYLFPSTLKPECKEASDGTDHDFRSRVSLIKINV